MMPEADNENIDMNENTDVYAVKSKVHFWKIALILIIFLCITASGKSTGVQYIKKFDGNDMSWLYNSKPLYDPAKVAMQSAINVPENIDTSGALKLPEENEQIPDTVKEIDKPFFYDIRYDNGKYYACIVTGYDPDYSGSEGGGWNYDEALKKEWHELDIESGTVSESAEKTEPTYTEGCNIFSNIGHLRLKDVPHAGDTYEREGYYCTYDENKVELYHYDILTGKRTLIYTDTKHNYGKVEMAAEGYVVYKACSNDYVSGLVYPDMYMVVDIEKKAVVLNFEPKNRIPYFIYNNNLYCIEKKYIDCLVKIDLKDRKRKNIQVNVSFYDLYASGDFVIASGEFKTDNKIKKGFFYINFTQAGIMKKIPFPDTCNGAQVIDREIGTIIGDRMYFTVRYGEYNDKEELTNETYVMYCFNATSGKLNEVFRSNEGVSKVIYASSYFCAVSDERIIYGKLGF